MLLVLPSHISQRCESRNHEVWSKELNEIGHISQRCESRNLTNHQICSVFFVTSRRDVRVEIGLCTLEGYQMIVTSRRDVRVEISGEECSICPYLRHISQRCESRNVSEESTINGEDIVTSRRDVRVEMVTSKSSSVPSHVTSRRDVRVEIFI